MAGPLLAVALLLGAPAAVFGLGEHGRRAGAELVVLQGDLERLRRESLPAPWRRGLEARIRGSLALLPLLLRLADQERGRTPLVVTSAGLAGLLERRGLAALGGRLDDLAARYPFPATGILPAEPTPRRLATARRLHRELCAGCHAGAGPPEGIERPALDLFRQARSMSPREFAARLVTGVRGDAVTGIDNPFTDEELAALVAYYRGTPPSPADRR